MKRGVPKESDEKDKAKEQVKLQALIETKEMVPPTHLLRRGNLQNKGPEVPPAAPLVLVSPVAIPGASGGREVLGPTAHAGRVGRCASAHSRTWPR